MGWVVREGRIYADPERIQSIVKAPFPKDKKSLMSFVALAGTLRRVMPAAAASELAKLYELTSSKKEYKPTQVHREAFEKCKEYLTSKPLYVQLPNPNAVKVLFSDSSSNIIGGVLTQVDFGPPVIEARAKVDFEVKEFSQFDHLGKFLAEKGLKASIFEHLKEEDEQKGAIECVMSQLKLMKLENYPKTCDEFLGSLCAQNQQLLKPHLPTYTGEIVAENRPVHKLLRLAALYLGRQCIYVECQNNEQEPSPWGKTLGCISVFEGGPGSQLIPPIVVANWHDIKSNKTFWYSLFIRNFKPYTKFTSLDYVANSWRELDQKQLFEKVKAQLGRKTGKKPALEVIAYISKTIPQSLVKRPIFEKEALGLLTNLHTTRDMHVGSPAVLAILDSQTAYFLFSKNISETVHKVHRWSISLREKYSNVLLYAVPSEANIADFLSRNFATSKKEKIDIKELYDRVDRKPQLEGRFLNLDEMRSEVEALEEEELAKARTMEAVSTRKTNREISDAALDVLNETLNPIMALQESLSVAKIREAQEKELSAEFEQAGLSETKDTKLEMGLLVRRDGDRWKMWIPPSLEGRVLALEHLQSGHCLGRDGLTLQVKSKYYFPQLSQKCATFLSGCWNCKLVKGKRERNYLQGTSKAPEYAFQIIYADLISGLPANKMKYTDVLTIVCPLSKQVAVFGLKSSASAPVIEHFKSFFQLTGFRTQLVYTDNGSTFRNSKFVQFMGAIGVKLAVTTVFNSRARGQVEVFNYLIEKILKSVLLTKTSYAWTDVAWLAAVFLNNSVHPSTKVSPYQVVFGSDIANQSNLGISLRKAAMPLLMDASLRKQAEQLRLQLNKVTKTLQQRIEQAKLKAYQRANRFRKEHNFQLGDVVFIKDTRLPAPGANVKFRPVLQPSPFMITEVNDHLIGVTRVVDRFHTRVNPNDVVKFRPGNPEIFQNIPEEVLKELEGGINATNLVRLGKLDSLPLLSLPPVDQMGENKSDPEKEQGEREEEEEEQEEEQDAGVFEEGEKTVRFAQ